VSDSPLPGHRAGNGPASPQTPQTPAPGALAILVNGEPATVPAGTTVADLLAARGATGKPCAVEINRAIVPRSQHAARALADGDAVEIVSFVGGG
jgi:sulfur carrier protein